MMQFSANWGFNPCPSARICGQILAMPIPETTSAEAYESYIGGKCLRACRGEAWRDMKACIIASAARGRSRALRYVNNRFEGNALQTIIAILDSISLDASATG